MTSGQETAIALATIAMLGPTGIIIARAMAKRIAGGTRDNEALREEIDHLRAEVADLRARSAEIDDVQNRLDFAERLLAQVRAKHALPGGK